MCGTYMDHLLHIFFYYVFAAQCWQQMGTQFTTYVGCLKQNFDTSIVQGSSSFAINMILRDHNNRYKGGKVMRFDKKVSVFEAEIIRIDESLSWISTRAKDRVRIEFDSLLAESKYHLEIGSIIDACRMKLASRHGVSLHYVRRLVNRRAHLVARIPCELNDYINLAYPPHQVLESLMYDVLHE